MLFLHIMKRSYDFFPFWFFFKIFIYLLLERGKGKATEKHQCVVASHAPPPGDLACNPGTFPDWESNWQSFG